jgi:hypothetical protein
MSAKRKIINMRFTPKQHELMDKEMERAGNSRVWIIKKALADYLAKHAEVKQL